MRLKFIRNEEGVFPDELLVNVLSGPSAYPLDDRGVARVLVAKPSSGGSDQKRTHFTEKSVQHVGRITHGRIDAFSPPEYAMTIWLRESPHFLLACQKQQPPVGRFEEQESENCYYYNIVMICSIILETLSTEIN
jgi:hypothetical protein